MSALTILGLLPVPEQQRLRRCNQFYFKLYMDRYVSEYQTDREKFIASWTHYSTPTNWLNVNPMTFSAKEKFFDNLSDDLNRSAYQSDDWEVS